MNGSLTGALGLKGLELSGDPRLTLAFV